MSACAGQHLHRQPAAPPVEWFETVDVTDRVVGRARRSECHGNPALVHRTAHVVVFSSDGRLLLQKRPAHKDIQPGRWDTAVGAYVEVLAEAQPELAATWAESIADDNLRQARLQTVAENWVQRDPDSASTQPPCR